MKKAIYITAFAVLSLCYGSMPCKAAQPVSMEQTEIQPYGDGIVWKYEYRNGRLYKRLYNASTDQWIGDWIPV